MTPETAADALPLPEKQVVSTAGMTTKVVKGSIWTLAGSVLPLMVSLVSTPFIIRFLGSEAYGVLLLVGLIPMYFSFADFGMGVASTKFAAEAYGRGDEKKEAEFVWTATAIAAVSALIITVPLFLFSYPIVQALSVPDHLLAEASTGLKITSGSFFLGILSSVLNSPMLARLRMDLNTLTQAGPRILLAVVTPFILYFGGHIVEAVGWAFIVALGTLAVVIYFSSRLLPRVLDIFINRDLVRPLVEFGGGWFIAMVATVLLVNTEKLMLARLVSVTALAYYSVAFTLGTIATTLSLAMLQSLVPAFSQLQSVDKKAELNTLFVRSIRLNLMWLLPTVMVMFVVARPFFTVWAGEDFGRESTLPFHILLIGLFFNILAHIPYTLIIASGRTKMLAKLYWIEFALYVVLAWFAVSYYGIIGAAVAWSVRAGFDAIVVIVLSRQIAKIEYRFLSYARILLIAAICMVVPLLLTILTDSWIIPISTVLVSVGVFFVWVWNRFVEEAERSWVLQRLDTFRNLYQGSE